MRQSPQFLIDQRHQLFEGLAVSSPPANEQLRYRTGWFLMQRIGLPQSAGGERGVAASLPVPYFLVNELKTQELLSLTFGFETFFLTL